MLENIPTIVAVSSPYQILCAIEALNFFKIDDYLFVIVSSNDSRDEQMRNTLAFFHINDYEWVNINEITYERECLKLLFRKDKGIKFSQLIIGSVENRWAKIVGIKRCKSHSNVLYVDDGNSTMSYLRGENSFHSSFPSTILKMFLKISVGFTESCLFFTVYSDVALPTYLCYTNHFKYLQTYNKGKCNSSLVYIIGTNSKAYCEKLGLSLEEYSKYFEELLNHILNKHLKSNVIFVPHGREKESVYKDLIKKYDIKCIRPMISVEMLLMECNYFPLAIYGYTSTALLNIKKLFPKTEVYDVCCYDNHLTKNTPLYRQYTEYFTKHGIKVINQCDYNLNYFDE